jgi:replication factor C subunit 3/5
MSDFVNNKLPWVEKYRPQQLSELVSQDNTINTLEEFIKDKSLPHILFYGPPGTGKTSTILACANRIYGKNIKKMTKQLNASDDRGINVVREKIKEFAQTKLTNDEHNIKLIILDEADSMTSDAQYALRRIIEEFSKTTRFCLICNYLNKVITALQSRCLCFRFMPIKNDDFVKRINFISETEDINITDDGMNHIIKYSNGDMRNAINIIQSLSMLNKEITEEVVNEFLNYPNKTNVILIINYLMHDNMKNAYNHILEIKNNNNYALIDIITEIFKYIINDGYEEEDRGEEEEDGDNGDDGGKEDNNIIIDEHKKQKIINSLSNIEFRLTTCVNEDLQIASLVSTFIQYR